MYYILSIWKCIKTICCFSEHSGMNSYVGNVLKSNCDHQDYPNVMKNKKLAMYVANILNSIDSK